MSVVTKDWLPKTTAERIQKNINVHTYFVTQSLITRKMLHGLLNLKPVTR